MPNDVRAELGGVDGRYILPMKRQVARQARPIQQSPVKESEGAEPSLATVTASAHLFGLATLL